MPPSAYPTPTLGGPQWSRCQVVDKKYPVTTGPAYYDGGQDTFGLPFATIIWEIEYGGLEAADANTLDAHNDSAYDTHLAFNFTDPETGVTYTVKYLEYQRAPRRFRWQGGRLVKLIHRP